MYLHSGEEEVGDCSQPLIEREVKISRSVYKNRNWARDTERFTAQR